MTETAPSFKSPLSQEALRQIHAVTGKLMRFKKGEEVDASTMQSLVGELLLNMRVIQYNMESSEHSSVFTAEGQGQGRLQPRRPRPSACERNSGL